MAEEGGRHMAALPTAEVGASMAPSTGAGKRRINAFNREVANNRAAAAAKDDELWEQATTALFPGSREHSRHVSRAASRDGSPLASRKSLSPWGSPKGAAQSRPIQLTKGEVTHATYGFSPKLQFAAGGFSYVFKVKEGLSRLPGAGPVAIKRLNPGVCGEDPAREVALLSSCHHEHILPLLGYTNLPPVCLVYPLMVGGSLEDRVLRTDDAWRRLEALGHAKLPPPLAWWQRLRILRDTARALVYLHTPAPGKPRTLHSDVKPANILLDANLDAHLADFGLARSDEPASPRAAPSGAAAIGGRLSGPASPPPPLPPSVSPRNSRTPPATPSLPRSLADSPHQYEPVWDDVPSDAAAAQQGSRPPSLPPSPPRRAKAAAPSVRAHPASPVTDEKARRPPAALPLSGGPLPLPLRPTGVAYTEAMARGGSGAAPPVPAARSAHAFFAATAAKATAAAAANSAAAAAPPRERHMTYGVAFAGNWARDKDKRFSPALAQEWAQLPVAGKPSIRGTPEYIDPLYVEDNCEASELTDGYAFGLTILVTLTGRAVTGPGQELMQRCGLMITRPYDKACWKAPGLPDAAAGIWPDRVACGLAGLVQGLAWEREAERRMPLPEALAALENLAETTVGGGDDF